MFILSNISIKWFLISFSLGLLLVYCTVPTPDVIVKYPTPDISKNLVFNDDANNCYKFDTEEVECPKDIKMISKFPIERKIEYFKQKNNLK